MRRSSGSTDRAAALLAALLAPLLAGACTQTPGTPPERGLVMLSLPGGAGLTLGSDPVATALNGTAFFLADPPARLAGRPAMAAQVAAQYEFATEELRELRFVGLSPLAQPVMAQGRTALRRAIGIAPDAPPRQASAQLAALAGALERGDLAAAEALIIPPVFARPPQAVLATLAAMPAVPEAGRAAGFAQQELSASMRPTN
jgi:hypothetical protein